MSLDEQIKKRCECDDEELDFAFTEMASSVIGDDLKREFLGKRTQIKNAFDEVLKYFGQKGVELADNTDNLEEQLDYVFKPRGIMYRTVSLDDNWWEKASRIFIAKTKNGITAVIPKGNGYTIYNPQAGKREKISKKNSEIIGKEAIEFYRTFPMRKLEIKDIISFCYNSVIDSGIKTYQLISLITIAVGFLLTALVGKVYSAVTAENKTLLLSVFFFMICTLVSKAIIEVLKFIASQGTTQSLKESVSTATMARLLSLQTNFFKKKSSASIETECQNMSEFCASVWEGVAISGITAVLSLLYVILMIYYGGAIVLPAMGLIALTLVCSLFTFWGKSKVLKDTMTMKAEETGIAYSMVSGIEKIKVCAAENRAFARWAKKYADYANRKYNQPSILKIGNVAKTIMPISGIAVIYYFAAQNGMSVSDYFAFLSGYAFVQMAFGAFCETLEKMAEIKPIYNSIKPILDEKPESEQGQIALGKVSGNIELKNIYFRYENDGPYLIENLGLKIHSGEYLGIVGKSGCGKSTLIRLLLGFEKPEKGAILYDKNDISRVDLSSLRQNIGTVLQADHLFRGDIFSNITISSDKITTDDAWKAAEIADIADDIRKMPMGMNTMITSDWSGFSGGQKQRLLIARAVANNPKILFFDEATSALDNISQKKVSDALAKMNCTRVVVAQRLSTVKDCDRILVLDKGKIAEEGTFDELMEKNGIFASMINKQLI